MLPRPQRLRSKKDFDSLWKHSQSVYGKTLGIKFAINKTGKNRVAVVVGTKISKLSTKRNLIRRQIREAVRKIFIKQLKGVDLAIITRVGILGRSYQQITNELEEVLKKTHLI